MKPSLSKCERGVAIDALAEELDCDEQTLFRAVRNEARLRRREEPNSDLRVDDLR